MYQEGTQPVYASLLTSVREPGIPLSHSALLIFGWVALVKALPHRDCFPTHRMYTGFCYFYDCPISTFPYTRNITFTFSGFWWVNSFQKGKGLSCDPCGPINIFQPSSHGEQLRDRPHKQNSFQDICWKCWGLVLPSGIICNKARAAWGHAEQRAHLKIKRSHDRKGEG